MSLAPQSILSKLRLMPDQELASFARTHQNDPYIFPLAFQESQDRQRLRSAKQAQAAGMQQPKVVQQDLQTMEHEAMPQQVAQGPLPEETGIGSLPAPNMETVHKASGGIIAFSGKEGSQVQDPNAIYAHIISEARRLGVDPNFALRMFKAESNFNPNAVSPKGAGGLGQLMPNTAKGLGLSEQDRFDPAKNVTASLTYMKSMLNKYGGDAAKAAAAYNWGPGNLDKHLKKNEGDLSTIGLPKETAKYLTKLLPIGEARAEDKELAQRRNMAPTITAPKPGEAGIPMPVNTGAAPAAETPLVSPERRANYGLKEKLLGSYPNLGDITWRDIGRNTSNTLNALGGWTAPASGVAKGVGRVSGELAPTAEAIAEADRLKKATELTRLAAPAKAGIAGLDEAAQATRAAAEQARVSRILAGDVQAAKGAEQSVKAAELTSNAARSAEEALAAQQQARALQSAQVANVGRGNAILGGLEDLASSPAASAVKATTPDVGTTPESAEDVSGVGGTKTKPAAVAAAKSGIGGLFEDPMFLMGMNLMAGKSRYATQNIGEAGINTAALLGQQKAAEQERAYKEALVKHYGVDSFVQRLEALKDPENAKMFQKMKELEREPVTKESLFKQFMTSTQAMTLKPDEVAPAFQKYVQSYEQMFGPLGGLPAGVKVSSF